MPHNEKVSNIITVCVRCVNRKVEFMQSLHSWRGQHAEQKMSEVSPAPVNRRIIKSRSVFSILMTFRHFSPLLCNAEVLASDIFP